MHILNRIVLIEYWTGGMLMRITFLGADHEVTGSCHYLQVADKNILIDCGMEQGNDVYENQELPIPACDVDYVLLTHAHIDHSGLIPLLYVNGFRGKIYCTEATVQLCDIMLEIVHIYRCLKLSGVTERLSVLMAL